MSRGLFITFEGNDGSGKTTISELVFKQLTQKGFSCILTREPGGIDIAEQIRHIILDPANSAMDARTEALLYAASRRQHLVERVIPALDEGKIVICGPFHRQFPCLPGHGQTDRHGRDLSDEPVCD